MNTTIEKKICEVYVLRNGNNVMEITLTSSRDNEVRIALNGSFGCYAHYFGACGEHYLKFLAGLKNNQEYMQRKFGIYDVTDEKATLDMWRMKALEEYEDGSDDLKEVLECIDYEPDIAITTPPRQVYDMYGGIPDTIRHPPRSWHMMWDEFLTPFFAQCEQEYNDRIQPAAV